MPTENDSCSATGYCQPAISVAIKVATLSRSFRITVAALRSQTIAREIELLLLLPSSLKPELAGLDFSGLQAVQLLAVDDCLQGGYKAIAARRATAPYLMFSEDHVYPAPDCLEQLLAAHEGGSYAAVGPRVVNANPTSLTSWGGYLVFYAQWAQARAPEDTWHLPANQSCYRRAILLETMGDPEATLAAESVLHWRLRHAGYQLLVEQRAVVHHLSTSRLGQLLHEYFLSSRVFASRRFSRRQYLHRLLYIIGSPLIPLLRLLRLCNYLPHLELRGLRAVASLAPAFCCLCAGTVGEVLGYAGGGGRAEERLIELMADPDKLVRTEELQHLANKMTAA